MIVKKMLEIRCDEVGSLCSMHCKRLDYYSNHCKLFNLPLRQVNGRDNMYDLTCTHYRPDECKQIFGKLVIK